MIEVDRKSRTTPNKLVVKHPGISVWCLYEIAFVRVQDPLRWEKEP